MRFKISALFFQPLERKDYFCCPKRNKSQGQIPNFRVGIWNFKFGFFIGAVAQSVEQRTENPCVGGSIPPHTTKALVFDNQGLYFL
jgi:hypothetical protein